MDRLPAYLYVADLVPGRRVLEVPCGDGDGAAFLARCGAARVIGVDGDRARVDQARRRHRLANLELRCEPPARLELEDASIDLLFVPDAGRMVRRREILDELRRVLAPGGWLIACAASADRHGAGDAALSFRDLGERLQGLFAPVRVAAQSPFAGVAVCEYGGDDAPAVALDRSLVEPGQEAEVSHYVAICGGGAAAAPRGYTVIEVPGGEAAVPAAVREFDLPTDSRGATVSGQIGAALAEHARQASDRETALAEAREYADELRDELERERLRMAALEYRAAEAGETAEELRRELVGERSRRAVVEGEMIRLSQSVAGDGPGAARSLAAELAEARRRLDKATDNWKQAERKNDEVWRRVGELQTQL
ncbi:MAG TPA: methyltransferase domain-containing protein, partial [Kofleriaceae bacterium]|nr:methyltransferase domain-containing protein [Kofleriaceae bacterium]